jgi:type IV pilus biogenesis protein CpaD/CtpE
MQKLRLEIGLPGGSVNRNLGDQILKQVQDDQEGKDMLVVEDGIWKNDETVLAAVRMRKVAIENRPPRRFRESQLVENRS